MADNHQAIPTQPQAPVDRLGSHFATAHSVESPTAQGVASAGTSTNSHGLGAVAARLVSNLAKKHYFPARKQNAKIVRYAREQPGT
jgi:hypothetical protein